jgi:hypothetical protein
MEFDHAVLELVRDTVLNRDMKSKGSFIFNQAAEKLRTLGVSALPELEQVLHREVMPRCDKDLNYVPDPYHGAAALLVIYFQLCGESRLQSAAQLLRSLRGPLRVEAIRAVNTVWLAQKPPISVPASLMDVVMEISTAGSTEERQVAEWLIQRQQKTDETEKDFRNELLRHLHPDAGDSA